MQRDYRHEAWPAAGRTAVVDAFCEVVRAGLERDDRLLVLATALCVQDVRDALGAEAGEVSFVAMDEHARNPSRVTSMLYRFGAAESTRRAVGVSELSLQGRSRAAQLELLLGECVLNSPTLQALPLSAVCVVDSEELDEAGLTAVRRSHPSIRGVALNRDFDAAWATELHADALPPPPAEAEELTIDARRLDVLRTFVHSVASGHLLPPDRVDDLVLAANEAVANSLRHGGGRAAVRVWLDNDALVCEIRDHGYVRDPMTGRLPPLPTSTGGRGLWLVHHLCDLVQLRSSERTGTTVRLFVER